MVFCRACGNQLHETAPACPGCGASQNVEAGVVSNGVNQGFWELSLQPLKKYADFKGRATRTEYWGFILVCTLAGFVSGFIEGMTQILWLSNLLSLAVFIPSIAVGIRRMHDTDRSGWWILLPIVNIVFFCFDSQREENRFGVCPKP
jgi:uncharacterized membrane protein YhaH (DUF805 family)